MVGWLLAVLLVVVWLLLLLLLYRRLRQQQQRPHLHHLHHLLPSRPSSARPPRGPGGRTWTTTPSAAFGWSRWPGFEGGKRRERERGSCVFSSSSSSSSREVLSFEFSWFQKKRKCDFQQKISIIHKSIPHRKKGNNVFGENMMRVTMRERKEEGDAGWRGRRRGREKREREKSFLSVHFHLYFLFSLFGPQRKAL